MRYTTANPSIGNNIPMINPIIGKLRLIINTLNELQYTTTQVINMPPTRQNLESTIFALAFQQENT